MRKSDWHSYEVRLNSFRELGMLFINIGKLSWKGSAEFNYEGDQNLGTITFYFEEISDYHKFKRELG